MDFLPQLLSLSLKIYRMSFFGSHETIAINRILEYKQFVKNILNMQDCFTFVN